MPHSCWGHVDPTGDGHILEEWQFKVAWRQCGVFCWKYGEKELFFWEAANNAVDDFTNLSHHQPRVYNIYICIYIYIYLKFWFPAGLPYVVREPAYLTVLTILTGAMVLDVLWSLPAPTGWKAFKENAGGLTSWDLVTKMIPILEALI